MLSNEILDWVYRSTLLKLHWLIEGILLDSLRKGQDFLLGKICMHLLQNGAWD